MCHAGRQHTSQLLELLIDENPKSLEGACRRVLPRLACADRFLHDRGKLSSGCDNPPCPSSCNRLCNRMSKPFLSIIPEYLRDLADGRVRQPIRHGLPAARVHAHVERRIEAKAHAPRAIVQLG